MEDIRKYESHMQSETNRKVGNAAEAEAEAARPVGLGVDGLHPLTPTNTPCEKNVVFFPSDDSGSK